MNLRGCKDVESKARSSLQVAIAGVVAGCSSQFASRSSQVAVAVASGLQDMQANAVAS